jgi:hypothetical protein
VRKGSEEKTLPVGRKNPSQSITDKLYRVLKKLRDENITPDLFTKIRNLHPRWPQLYGNPNIVRSTSLYSTSPEGLYKGVTT